MSEIQRDPITGGVFTTATVPAEDGRACPRGCGWRNTWPDSGDRGAEQHYHDTYECPNRLTS